MASYHSAKGSLEYTIVGNPTIENGIVSNFTNNDYLLVPFTTAIGTADFEMKTAVICDSGGSLHRFFGGTNGNYENFTGLYWGRANVIGAGIIINNTFYQLASSTKAVGTKYYVILYRKGTTFGLKISTDNVNFNEEYTSTVPEGNITIDGGNTFCIGSSGSAYRLPGSIDLNETYVAVNGRPWFGVYPVAVQKHQLRGPVGYTVVGSPTITDGVVSGFSQSDYLKTTENRPAADQAEYNIKFTTSTLGTAGNLCGRENSNVGIAIQANGTMSYYAYYGGNAVYYPFSRCVVLANTTYTVNMLFKPWSITCKLYDSNSQLIASQSVSTGVPRDASTPFVFGKGAANRVFNGSIDFNETYIKINGKLWFRQPMETKYIIKDGKLVWADPRIYVQEPGSGSGIDENTLAVFHFEDNTDNAVAGSSIGFNQNANVAYQSTYALQGFGKYAQVTTSQLLSVERTDYYSALTVDLRYIYPGGSTPNLYLISNPGQDVRVWIGTSAGSLCVMYNNAEHPYGALAWQGTSTSQNVHVAVEVYNGNVNIYVDGTLVTSFATTYNFAATCNSSAALVWLDELRISNVARYQGQSFTPPAEPYGASTPGAKNYATQNMAPVPAGYTYGNTTTPSIGYVDMRTQQFTAAPSGATIGRDE